MKYKPVVLLILDGWGIAPKSRGNAIELAKKPNFDRLWNEYPHTKLKAHGQAVGVPKGWVGNSEAGHVNLGAGRKIEDDAVTISRDIRTGRFKKNYSLNQAMKFALENKSALHLMGLVSDGQSPHSSLDHLIALVDLAHSKGIEKIYLHAFTDGRDSPQFYALKILEEVERRCKGRTKVVSIMGRYFAMDRGKNWPRTKRAYDCLTGARAKSYKSYRDAIIHAYNKKVTDEFIEPSIIADNKADAKDTRVQEGDSIIFFNARSDRARQLTKCFVQKEFNKLNRYAFRRSKVYKNLKFCALTNFGPDLDSILTAYPSETLENTLPHILKDYRQVYLAETEKYAHVTYFINGGSDVPINGEARIKVESPAVKNYINKPQMSVYEITDKAKQMLDGQMYDFFAINFANPDMLGHAGDLKAVIKAVEHVDKCIGTLAETVLKHNGTLMIVGDHGNAEQMLDPETGEVWTGHTTNPVPFMLIDNEMKNIKLTGGDLGQVAPTIYKMLKIKLSKNKLNNGLIK